MTEEYCKCKYSILLKVLVISHFSFVICNAQNKEAINKKSRERYKNLSQEKKDKIKEYQRKKYQELVQYKKEALKNK